MDLHSNLQADLQKDLQVDLQTDLQADLQVRTGLGATQNSPLVLFQAETSTEREKPRIWMRNNPTLMLPDQCTSMGGTCEQRRLSPGSRRLAQGPNHVIGELPIKSSARRKFGECIQQSTSLQGSTTYTDLQDSQHHRIYTHTSEEQCSSHSLRCLQHSGNALTPWSIQSCLWAIWLHHLSVKRE